MEEKGREKKDIKKVKELFFTAGDAPKRLIFMAVCGILILLLSVPEIWKGWTKRDRSENKESISREEGAVTYSDETERKLEEFLENIEGVGKIRVMLTKKSGGEGVKKSSGYDIDTGEDENGVEGVLIIMEGADNAKLKSEIIEGIEVLFGIPVHKIKVIRMKTAESYQTR